ncbi:MAG: hypothetical protein HOI34_10805 [Rhodospirillaceae bacterium]|jgi:hypothetical protein|nr:hypothetical protein [Rhodospirillaceae bacterium]MBT6204176.1 hypothetical protein [Rhodospirillaceae bacterium]MBT6510497.1 hypothetical protein [Rhodospirillaceae bacterium]MBT7614482.1 hypothetical protein [Rhodospirillaceae bacterium]
MDPSSLIDLDRYPIDRLDAPDGRALVDGLRHDLDAGALAFLPGFIRPQALAALVADVEPLFPQAHRRDRMRTPYGWMDNSGFPEDHPRRAMHRNSGRTITRDMLVDESTWPRLFEWPVLTEFVRRVLGFETLHCSADPWLSLEFHIEAENDQLAWHYDTNDGVVSLLLQSPDEGGDFEHVPFLRDENDEHYDEVARVFDGSSERIRRLPLEPGTFALFRGRRSIHRVAPVGHTAKPRLIALFSYDREPGMVFPEATVKAVIDPDDTPHTGTPAS